MVVGRSARLRKRIEAWSPAGCAALPLAWPYSPRSRDIAFTSALGCRERVSESCISDARKGG